MTYAVTSASECGQKIIYLARRDKRVYFGIVNKNPVDTEFQFSWKAAPVEPYHLASTSPFFFNLVLA